MINVVRYFTECVIFEYLFCMYFPLDNKFIIQRTGSKDSEYFDILLKKTLPKANTYFIFKLTEIS